MLEEKFAEIARKKTDKALSTEDRALRRRILAELAPRLWAELRSIVKTQCSLYPELRYEIWPASQIVVRYERTFLRVNYLPASNLVDCKVGAVNGEYRIVLNEDDRAVLVDADDGPYLSAEYVAERLLADLLR